MAEVGIIKKEKKKRVTKEEGGGKCSFTVKRFLKSHFSLFMTEDMGCHDDDCCS